MSTPQPPVIILVAGHWLGAWAWDAVIAALSRRHDVAVALTLPGLDPDDPARLTRTLDDQAAAIIAGMEAAGATRERPVVLVGHSGANAPICVAMDRRPELIAHVVWVDTGPVGDGMVVEPDLPADVLEVGLPAFDVLGAQASLGEVDALDGLDEATLERFRRRAVSEPASVLRAAPALRNEARRHVPSTMVYCSIPAAQILEWVRSGHPWMRELAATRTYTVTDLPTGHWPMWSRPEALARIIHEAAEVATHAAPA